jgi:CheY-like chemotaxis protein
MRYSLSSRSGATSASTSSTSAWAPRRLLAAGVTKRSTIGILVPHGWRHQVFCAASGIAGATGDYVESFRYRILIVDDEPSLRQLGKLLLEAQGYEVLCAEDGFEGLAALKESLPDIIISDLRMPNMNGFEFLSVVRRRFPTIPVIVISSEFTGVSVPESVLADAFFSKGGFKPDELV